MNRTLSKILAYLCFAAMWLLSLLPLWVHYILSDLLYLILYYVVGYRINVVRRNISSSFPEKSEKELKKIEHGFYHWFCDYLVESVKLMTMSRRQMRRRMVFKGTEEIERLWAEGKSCGVLLGHYCNWEWISTLPLAMSDKGVCAELYHPIENPEFDRLFLYIRQRFDSVCIPMQETLRHIVRYQREGRPMVIGYIADQKPNWRNTHLWLPFLNHPETPVFTGTERIIQRTRQAFFYGDVRRVKRGHYECTFRLVEENSWELPENEITRRYMAELEKTILRDPAPYLWSHNRWSRTKEEFDTRFYINDGKVYEKMSEQDYAAHKGITFEEYRKMHRG